MLSFLQMFGIKLQRIPRRSLLLVVVLLSLVLDGRSERESSPEPLVLDLRKGNDLTWLYDAGFRPRYGVGPLDSRLEVLNEKVKLVLLDGGQLILPCERVKIAVAMGGE